MLIFKPDYLKESTFLFIFAANSINTYGKKLIHRAFGTELLGELSFTINDD